MKEITVEQLHERVKKNENLHILDVREQDEYDENNIGSKLWPLSKLRLMDANGLEGWQSEEIIVHCRGGHRSLEACLLLETMGFNNVVNLSGGIKEWQDKYPNEKLS